MRRTVCSSESTKAARRPRYSSTALAAHQPADCDVVKGLAQMIVRGFVVSTVGAIIGILPVLATQVDADQRHTISSHIHKKFSLSLSHCTHNILYMTDHLYFLFMLVWKCVHTWARVRYIDLQTQWA